MIIEESMSESKFINTTEDGRVALSGDDDLYAFHNQSPNQNRRVTFKIEENEDEKSFN